MKIAYVITRSDVMGGASVHLLDLAAGMMRAGHQVIIFVGGTGVVIERATEMGIRCVSLKYLVREIRPFIDVCCFFELFSHLKRYKPDIVHLHSSKAGIVGRLVSKCLCVPSVFTAHGWAFTEGVSKNKRIFYLFVERYLSHFSKKIITVSEYDRNLAIRSRVGSCNLIQTINNCIPDIQASTKSKASNINTVFVMVARFDQPKDQMLLVNAFSKLDNQNWLLELIGDGPLMESVRSRVTQLELEDKVLFSGACSDVSRRLNNADVFCLISNWEGFPLTILEAMRASLPVIASDVGGVSEAVVDGDTGYLVPRGDLEAISIAIGNCMILKENRETMGMRARQVFEQNFMFENMLEKTLAVYREVLDCNK